MSSALAAGFARSPLRRERCIEAESARTDLWQDRKTRSEAIVTQRTRLQRCNHNQFLEHDQPVADRSEATAFKGGLILR